MNGNKLSIIIPAHNEAGRIGPTLNAYVSYFSENYPGNHEILVVLNGCEDETLKVVNHYACNNEAVRVHTIPQKGKGYALKHGFRAANGSIVSFTDADGATSPSELHRLVKQIDGNDGIIASRWLPGSVILRRQRVMRRVASRVLNIMVRLMFALPFSDTQCGAKVFKKEALDAVVVDLVNGDFTFDIELLYKMRSKGFRIMERAIAWEDKSRSRLNIFTTVPQMLTALFRLWADSEWVENLKGAPVPLPARYNQVSSELN